MIQALNRAAAILREVAKAGKAGVKLADLARAVALNKTTAYHLAETLVAEGLLAKTEVAYHIGPLVRGLAEGLPETPWYEPLVPGLGEIHRRFAKWSFIVSELGRGDLFMRHGWDPETPGVSHGINDQTLNPYTTVSGLLHFAWLPEERLADLRLRHPFETKGLDHWGSWAAFEKAVKKSRRNGFSETPKLVHGEQVKFGLPLLQGPGVLLGALTCTAIAKGISDLEGTRKEIQAAVATLLASAIPPDGNS